MPWSDTLGSTVDLTHLKDMGTFAVGVGITFYPSQLIPAVMGSTYLITVAAESSGTAYVTLIVDHLDPSGNTVWSQKLPGVYAVFEDGPTVVKGACYASDIRVTVGVGDSTEAGTPVASVVRVYSSPNQQQRPTRVVGSSVQDSDMTDANLVSFFDGVDSGTVGPFPLRPYAGVASTSLIGLEDPITDIRAYVEFHDSEGTVFGRHGLSAGQGTMSLPAGVNNLFITNIGASEVLKVLVSIVADDYTL